MRAKSRRPQGRIVCTLHQPPGTFERHIGPDTRLNLADAVIVQAPNQAGYLDSRIAAGKLHIVAHGVDTDYFRPRSGSPAPPGRFVSAGSWLRDFGALREIALRVQQHDPRLRFTVVADAAASARLRGLPNVDLLGGLSNRELLGVYHAATAMILPLRDATANNALLEGMSCCSGCTQA